MSVLAALALLLQAPAAAASPPPSQSGAVVVTARRRGDAEAALRACLARNCPPDEDAAAALALAEVEFVVGDYDRAGRTVDAALGRTRKQARAYPVPVSDLFRAKGRIAAHRGEDDELRIAAINARDTLAKGLSAGDPRVLGADIERADMFYRIGQPGAAEAGYRAVIERAAAAGHGSIEGFARLRLATLQTAGKGQPEPGAIRRAAATLAPMVNEGGPLTARFRLPAALLLARLAERRGDTEAIDRVLKTIPAAARTRPILLSGDPINLPQRPTTNGDTEYLSQTMNFARQWIDVGFWIGDDGTVRNAEVIRAGSPRSDEWHKPVLRAIRSRRYAPPSGSSAANAYRIERYTLTAGYWTLGASRIRQRRPELRIEVLDLTAG